MNRPHGLKSRKASPPGGVAKRPASARSSAKVLSGETAAIWDRVLRSGGAPSPAAARELLKLQFEESDRRKMSELAAKARAGTLTLEDERQAETYEQVGCLLDIMHSRARRVLKRPRKAS